MILKIPENRLIIIDYLNNVDEDTFIDEFVIPFFSSQGFQVYRINSHGSGEHGKDIIFCRYVPMFFESEFIVVQAKAEKVTTSNVNKFSEQIKRALKTTFAPRSGNGDLKCHYAVFINARKHTNEAYIEFPQLVKSAHVKILSQENVCDLIMLTGIAPKTLLSQISTGSIDTFTEEDKLIYDILMKNNPAEVEKLLNHQLKLVRSNISDKTKSMVVDYIYNRWKQDPSWEGTIQPMMWFDEYFDFFTEDKYSYFFDIFREFVSSTHSFKAMPYTRSICDKITPEMLATIAEKFIKYCVEISLSYMSENEKIIISKLNDLSTSGLVHDGQLASLMRKVLKFVKLKRSDDEFDTLYDELYKEVWSD